jgi:hypothetical protein
VDDHLPVHALFQALVFPPLGAAYYVWLWYLRGTLQPPGRHRIGFRRGVLDDREWVIAAAQVGPPQA